MSSISVRIDQTILDCVKAIDESGQGLAYIVDSQGHLLGCVTDGDIRRALLRNTDEISSQELTLESKAIPLIMNSDYISVDRDTGNSEILGLMRLHGIPAVPVVDGKGRLVGNYRWKDLVGRSKKENWAVIMAGGKGSRLGSITENIPKPMLTIGGTPILERIVRHLVSYGIGRIFLAVNHLSEVIEQHFGDGSNLGCEIDYLREEKPLGTGGALSLLPEIPEHDVVVMNGDLVTQIDINDFLHFHTTSKHDLTMAVRNHFTELPYGVVDVKDGLVEGLSEKPQISRLINCGMYVLSPEVLQMVPKQKSIPITWLVENCLGKDKVVAAYLTEGEWIDIGDPSQLRRAREED